MDVNLVGELRKSMSREEVQMQMKDGTKGCFPVPGSLKNCLSKTEESSFILGLYIFGKNLVQVRKFLESKDMGDVMAHYYGKFYGSLMYRRWSECRKMKSRRCIFGQKIFVGLRQQEFLSRLLPQVSVENQSRLLEVNFPREQITSNWCPAFLLANNLFSSVNWWSAPILFPLLSELYNLFSDPFCSGWLAALYFLALLVCFCIIISPIQKYYVGSKLSISLSLLWRKLLFLELHTMVQVICVSVQIWLGRFWLCSTNLFQSMDLAYLSITYGS